MDHRLLWSFGVFGVVVVGAALAWLASSYIPEGDRELTGYVSVYDYDPVNPYTGGGCTDDRTGPGEFADLYRGAPIVVRDSAGTILAESELGPPSESLGTCYFAFRVGPVPDADAYVVTVGDRAPATFAAEELDRRGWSVTFDYGGQAASP